eukprot:CAMPEP_0178914440 /NCGR_PEP_ID=MMETSP0786-20121207/11427_1 /TAXON_ID=186022 /ORGANISM="Thalassionema frauenfeldii, Strain CCMP 1798" /LENGTH=248 /DNA_ID=CAMNT_0020587349 /DNA_START=105 /DNA_END=848 /DNA_ORIENTATION=-
MTYNFLAISTVAFFSLFATCNSFSPTIPSLSRNTRIFSTQSRMSEKEEPVKPDILQPFLPAADPKYAVRGQIGEGDFVVTRDGAPTQEELTNENIIKIVKGECTDLEVNTLMWKCLGYRFDADSEEWKPDEVFPNWREKHPTPPDFIGMRRMYSKDIDEISLRSTQALARSIPLEFKQSLKTHLKPLGFRGFKYAELTPNKTRRAQTANWLLFYREELFGYTVEELKERREKKKREAEESETENEAEW